MKQTDKVITQKKVIIYFLYLGALIIIFLGAFWGTFSAVNDINLKVLNSSVPGLVFGLVIVYLGLRYFFMVSKFKPDFLKSTDKFSWSNFKREKRKERLVVPKK
jgi:hypothetical protein